MLTELTSKIAVVTGAANGIGLALAHAFGRAGMRVVLADIDSAALGKARAGLVDCGVDVLAVPTDVGSDDSVEALAEASWDHFGAVHLLCNNAGLIGPRGLPAWQIAAEDWERVFSINVLGVVRGLRAFIPRMKDQNTACHLVNTASVMGFISSANVSAQYSSSKHAVVSLTETLRDQAEESLPWLGVSLLCPGPVETDLRRHNLAQFESAEEAVDEEKEDNWDSDPIRERVSPEKVAAEVVEAVRTGRFYIFPNVNTAGRIRPRFEEILRSA